MNKNEMCVRTKQVSPGVYKTVSKGFVKALSGHYRVPVGTILIPDMDSMIVRTEWGNVYWRSDPINCWWIGWVLPTCSSVREYELLDKIRAEDFFNGAGNIEALIERDGTMWMLQLDNHKQCATPKWRGQKILKMMLKSNEVNIPIAG